MNSALLVDFARCVAFDLVHHALASPIMRALSERFCRVVVVAMGVLGLAVVLGTSPAGAQSDPYGPTSTTTVPGSAVSCQVSVASGAPGSPVEGSVDGATPGSAGEVLLGGTTVGDFAVAAAGSAEFDFAVPVLEPGDYVVTVVGPTYNAECVVPGGGVLFAVLAAADSTGDDDGAGGDLAFTGGSVLVLVLVGLMLVAIGYAIRQRVSVSHSRR